MEFKDKARIRLEHWIEHSDHHLDEYEQFAGQLEDEGMVESARHIREMMDLEEKSTTCLKKALEALD
ncbi:MAG: hypothetical protein R6V25_06210 [Desulfatiglandales bacterium]